MFSQQAEREIDRLLARYPRKRSAIIPVLFIAQKERGYLSDDVLEYVAKRMGLTYLDVVTVVSFYTMFYRRPIGKYNIQLCNNVSCMLCGSEKIQEHIERKLGITFGQTTPDGRFTFTEVQCLGSCGTAPVMQVNFDYYENLTPEKVDQILDSLP
ncbi:MAG: NADH-quinone oxidoreductase subunit NuoE [Acidobacteria bacterium]|nr:MAG: NADH-quinone oxidoreductase subunit NuoE [Acidobacteriota bacterium]